MNYLATTVYVATIVESRDYDGDVLSDMEAFFVEGDAEAFMVANGLTKIAKGMWENKNDYSITGTITKLEVK